MDKLMGMFDTLNITYSDLNKPISKAEKRRLDRNIDKWQEQGILNGYLGYLIASKKKYTYSDLLEILIYGIYAEKEEKQYKLSKEVFTVVANDIYNQACSDLNKKSKKKITWSFIDDLIWVAIYNKSFKDYLSLLTLTAQQEMNKQILSIIQQNKELEEKMIVDLIDKQNKRFLSINDDKFSGILSDACRTLGNKAYTEPFKEDKDLQVRFIAEMDKRTTEMCESMNNMLFFVNDWNKFYRYSDIDGRDVLYTVKGLEQGINLPPINNHFHWCRSTITYLTDKDIRMKYKDITNNWFKKVNKKINYQNIKKYKKGDKFVFRGIEYTVDDDLVKYDFKNGEEEFANELSKQINEKIILVPKIDINGGVSTPDFIIGKKEYDLKTNTGRSKQLIYHAIQGKEAQSHNFFIDATNSPLTFNELVEQLPNLYDRTDVKWVEIVGIKKGKDFAIFERK